MHCAGSNEGEQDIPTDETTPTLPPLPPEQLDTVVQVSLSNYQYAVTILLNIIQLLIGAIQRNYVEETHCQFASQLLLMTLGFLNQMIRSQVLLEEGPTLHTGKLHLLTMHCNIYNHCDCYL